MTFALLAWLLTTVTAQTITVTNPTTVVFECPNHDLDTDHQLLIHHAGGWPTVVSIGDPPVVDGTVTATLPAIAPGSYFATVRWGVNGAWGPESANSNSFAIAEQLPAAPAVQMDVTQCKVTLTATPPDDAPGWRAQFLRDGATSVGNRDAEAPFERSTTLTAGPHTFSVRWTKPDGTTQTSALVSVACPALAPPAPVDCVGAWSEWTPISEWTACSAEQQSRTVQRTFTVTTPASNGGRCDALTASPETQTETRACTMPPPPPPDPIGPTLTASALTVAAGADVTLTLFTPGADYHGVTINGLRPTGGIGCPAAGCTWTLLVRPVQTTTYQAAATTAGGVKQAMPALTITVTGAPPPPPPPDPLPPSPPVGCSPQATTDAGNAYYNGLLARKDCWRAYALRDPKQLLLPSQGGLLYSNNLWNPWTYDAAMDAAKATVPEFAGVPTNALAAPLDASSTTASFNGAPGDYAPKVSLKVGSEVIQLVTYPDPTTRVATILRGTRGTSAAAHPIGTPTYLSTNSVKNMIVLPLGTSDGNTYLFTWDSYWTDSYRFGVSGNNYYKTWQLHNGGTWVEPRTRFDGGEQSGPQRPGFDITQHVAALDFRLYYPGSNVAAAAPAAPMAGQFHALPNAWLRHFVLIEQRANACELLTAWAADETRGPVKLLDRLEVCLRQDGRAPNSIDRFWVELDSSQDTILTRQVGLNLVSYHRNFVALVNPGDVAALLQRPVR